MFWPYWGVNSSYSGWVFVNAGLSDRRTPWINGGDGCLAWFCQTNMDFDTRCWFSQQTVTLEAPAELPNTKAGAKTEGNHAVKHLRETTAIRLRPASVTFDLQSSSSGFEPGCKIQLVHTAWRWMGWEWGANDLCFLQVPFRAADFFTWEVSFRLPWLLLCCSSFEVCLGVKDDWDCETLWFLGISDDASIWLDWLWQ